METAFSKEDLEFQKEVQTFIKENYPQELRNAVKEKTRTGQELSKEEISKCEKDNIPPLEVNHLIPSIA